MSNEIKPHNPDGLESPGEGYRFLDEDEIKSRAHDYEAIEWWNSKLGNWLSWWEGCSPALTYRTKLSREELAKLV